jgi:methionine-rich copper-binding protein CopC
MSQKWTFIGIIALCAAAVTSMFKSDAPDPLANPQVMRTSPAGDAVVPAGPVTLSVTFDVPMQADSYSFVRADDAAFPDCPGKPRQSADKLTYSWDCTLKPGTAYRVWFNRGAFMNFKGAQNQVPAMSYGISFSTR